MQCLVLASLLAAPLRGQDAPAELPPEDDWTRTLRVTADLSLRGVWDQRAHQAGALDYAGVDLRHVFQSRTADLATLVLQVYGLRVDNVGPRSRPTFVDDAHAFDLEWRVCALRYRALGDGALNLEAGHLELPYGLEHAVATNGTLREFQHRSNLGLKYDWGVGASGAGEDGEYAVTLTRGSGNGWHQDGAPFALCGRIATPAEDSIVFGLSAYHADLWDPAGGARRRTRLGGDLQLTGAPVHSRFELSLGRDDGRDLLNAFTELSWATTEDAWLLYLQTLATWERDAQRQLLTTTRLRLGALWLLDAHWALSGQLEQDLHLPGNGREDTVLMLQVRWRS